MAKGKTLESLNFELIVKNDKFNRAIDNAIKKAKEANREISELLDLQMKVAKVKVAAVGNEKDILDLILQEGKAQTKLQQAILDTLKTQKKKTSEDEKEIRLIEQKGRLLRGLTSLSAAYFSVAGVERLARNLIQVTGEFEMQRTALRAILQDVNAADGIFEKIKSLAVISPFTFKDLISYTKQLSAFSVPVEELYDTTKMLADVSAGLGVGMDRLILAYGQIRSASFLRGQEVRQLTESGVPILEELKKEFEAMGEVGISVGDVFDKISARQVPFEMIAKIFTKMTSEGGKFYQMQEVQAQTLQGKISNLTDAYQLMFNEIGQKLNPAMKASVDFIRSLAQNYEEIGKEIAILIASYGAMRVATTSYLVLSGQLAVANTTLGKTFSALGKIVAKNPYVAIAAGFAVAVTWIYKLAAAESELAKTQKKLEQDFYVKFSEEASELEVLYTKLRLATKGTEEYEKARDAIYSKYSAHIEALKEQGKWVENEAEQYRLLRVAIEDAAKAQMRDTALASIKETFGEGMDKLYNGSFNKSLKHLRKDLDLTAGEAAVLWEIITGNKTLRDLKGIEEFQGLLDKISAGSVKTLTGRQTALSYLQELTQAASDLKDEYTGAYTSLDTFFTATANQSKNNAAALSKEAELIQNVLKKFGISQKSQAMGLWFEDGTDSHDKYLESIRKRYQEIYKLIQDSGTIQKDRVESLKKEQSIIEAIAKAMGVSLYGDSKKNGEKNARQNEIEANINAVKELMDWYEKLTALGLNDNVVADLLNAYIPGHEDIVNTKGFTKALNDYATELEQFGEAGKSAAEKLRTATGGDNLDILYKQMQAFEKYRQKLQAWMDKDFNLQGADISFDISKILADLSTKNMGVDSDLADLQRLFANATKDEELLKKIREAYGEEVWNKYMAEGDKVLKTLADKEKDYNKKVAQEKLNDLASRYVKERLQIEDINLSDWSDKSLAQIKAIGTRLSELINENIELDPSISEKAKELGVDLDSLYAAIKAIFEGKYENTLVEQLKKVQTISQKITNLVSQVGSSLESAGQTMGVEWLEGFGHTLDVIGEIADALAENKQLLADMAGITEKLDGDISKIAESSDWITMIVKIALIGIREVAGAIGKAKAEQIELQRAAMEYRKTMRDLRSESAETIFGKDEFKALRIEMENMTDALGDYEKAYAGFLGSLKQTGRGKQEIDQFADALKKVMGLSMSLSTSKTLAQFSELLNPQSDAFDLEAARDYISLLKENRKVFDNPLDNSSEEAFDSLIASLEEVIARAEAVEQSIDSMFDSLADNIVDNMVNAFNEVGDAVSDLENAFGELGESIIRSVMKSYILDEIVSDFKPKIEKAIKDFTSGERGAENAISLSEALGRTFAEMAGKIEQSGDLWNQILQAAKDAGLIGNDNTNDNTLGNGIKSITEDTANLLASYVNAIRADVGASRVTLTDIQANTLRTAVASEAILARLNAVIGTSSTYGGEGIKVVM